MPSFVLNSGETFSELKMLGIIFTRASKTFTSNLHLIGILSPKQCSLCFWKDEDVLQNNYFEKKMFIVERY
jgi:hypothetical protein